MNTCMKITLLLILLAIIGACGYIGEQIEAQYLALNKSPAMTLVEGHGWALLEDGTKIVKEIHTYPWYDLGGQE